MTKPYRIGLAALALACGFVAFAQQQDFSKVEMKSIKVAGSVYLLQGGTGGNIAASVGDDGIIIVDDQYAPLADKIRAALKGITSKPLRFVINTHFHDDHAGGNEAFHQNATIIAHENVRKRLASGGTGGNGGSMKFEFKPAPQAALPIITFERDVTVHLNGENVRALHVPPAHTDGDSFVFFQKSNVVHMGDVFVTYGFPFIDLSSGGSVDGMITALESAITQLPADVKVIPGHGPVSSLDDVRRYITMLKETRAIVQNGIKAGKTLEQLQQEKVLDKWKNQAGVFIPPNVFIETIYNDLTGKKSGETVKHNP